MKETMLIFETDPRSGTPKLRAINSAARIWNSRDLGLLEEELRPRYDGLVREGAGTIEFKGRTLHVKKKDGDTSRQPTLELRSEEPSLSPQTDKGVIPLTTADVVVDWGQGFLGELDRLFGTVEFKGILPVEKAMLQLVRDELKGMVEKIPATETALLMLVSILMMAEHLSRTQRPGEPHPYTFALSGIERVLKQQNVPFQTVWGTLPAKPNPEPPPWWLARLWNRVTGAS